MLTVFDEFGVILAELPPKTMHIAQYYLSISASNFNVLISSERAIFASSNNEKWGKKRIISILKKNDVPRAIWNSCRITGTPTQRRRQQRCRRGIKANDAHIYNLTAEKKLWNEANSDQQKFYTEKRARPMNAAFLFVEEMLLIAN